MLTRLLFVLVRSLDARLRLRLARGIEREQIPPLAISWKVSSGQIDLASVVYTFYQHLDRVLEEFASLENEWALAIKLFDDGDLSAAAMPEAGALAMLSSFPYDDEYSLLILLAHPMPHPLMVSQAFEAFLASAQEAQGLIAAAGSAARGE